MINEQTERERRSSTGVQRPAKREVRARLLPNAAAFAGGAGLVLAYALPGGAYDLIIRQEYGIVLWWVLAACFACGLLPRSRPSREVLFFLGALVVYAAWTGLSLGWTNSSERTTAELARVLDYAGLFTLIVATVDRSTWRAAALGLGAGALIVCALAVASRLIPSAFPAVPFYQPHGTNRLSYPFGYWNAVGAWGAMSATLGLAWSVHDSVWIRRALALGLVPIAVLATYLSYSRAGVVGLVLGAVAVLALSRHRLTAFIHTIGAAGAAAILILAVRDAHEIAHGTGTHGSGRVVGAMALAVAVAAGLATLSNLGGLGSARLPRRLSRPILLIGAVLALIGAGAFGPHVVSKAWNQFRHQQVPTTSDPTSRLTQLSGTRYAVWKTALKAFTSQPITGTGAGTFEFWWDAHGTTYEFVRNAHSFEIENMAELGAPGLVLMVAIMAGGLAVLVAVRRRVRRSASAGAGVALLTAFVVFLVQASVDWLWQVTALTALALAAVATAGGRLAGEKPRLDWQWRAAITLVAALGALVNVPGMLSTAEIRRSQAAERAGNAALALSWANAAVGAEPWAASAYEQRGLVLESAGRLAPAAQDLNRAISHESMNFRHWLILARIETERGRFAAAVRDYDEAHHLRPRGLVFASAPYFKLR